MYLGYMMESLSIMTQFIYSIYNYTSLKGQVNRELSSILVFFQPTHQNWTETLTNIALLQCCSKSIHHADEYHPG